MIGRTNVAGAGATFSATLEITTDPNAVITAVNPAGDTFSGTADSSGDLTLVVNKPGTYTLTETDGGVETIVVADDGETYLVEVLAFNGELITSAVTDVNFESIGYAFGQYSSNAPTVTNTTFGGTAVIQVFNASFNAGMYITSESYDITDFSYLKFRGCGSSSQSYLVAVDETNAVTNFGSIPAATISDQTIALQGLDNTKEYRFGLWVMNGSTARITDLKLDTVL